MDTEGENETERNAYLFQPPSSGVTRIGAQSLKKCMKCVLHVALNLFWCNSEFVNKCSNSNLLFLSYQIFYVSQLNSPIAVDYP